MSIIVYNEVAEPIIPTPGELLILGLFARGEQGGAWDFTSPGHLYQDAGGATPVTSFGNPIGLAMDLSPNGNHLRQQTTAARPTFTADGARHDGVDDLLTSADANDWVFLHDGSGGTLAVSMLVEDVEGTAIQKSVGTYNNTSNAGVRIGWGDTNAQIVIAGVSNGTGTTQDVNPGVGSGPRGVFRSMIANTSDSLAFHLNGELQGEVELSGLSSSAPQMSLRTLTLASGRPVMSRRVFAINRVLSPDELAILNAWLMEGVE